MEKYKTVKEKKELYIEFSDEEIKELGWKENQKLSMTLTENGAISIQPYVEVEIDISNYPKEILQWLIQESVEKDISVNEVICNVIESYISEDKTLDKLKKNYPSVLLCEKDNK